MSSKSAYRAPSSNLQLTSLLGDFRLLLILFVGFRLMMTIVYMPVVVDGIERGVGAGGDQTYYYQLAAQAEDGLLPFRDWWSEFPPIWSYLTVAVYLGLGENANYTGYAIVIGLIMIAFDAGILVMIRRIGTRLHGANTAMSLCWVYAITFAPMVFLWWTFETMVAFSFLLGIWWLMVGKDVPSAVSVAIGTLTKFVPVLILGAVWRYRNMRSAIIYSGVAVGLFILAYVPLLLFQDPDMATASLFAQFNKASYQSVWALIDGNFTTGIFGSVEDHLDPANARTITGNPAVIPGIVRLGVAGAIGLGVFLTTRRRDDKGLLAFVGVTMIIFFLQSQGWSPQWMVQIIPVFLLTYPTKNGILATVLLSLIAFAEYPFLFIRTGDTGGVITGALIMPYALLIIARTTLLVAIAVAFYVRLRQEPVPSAVIENRET